MSKQKSVNTTHRKRLARALAEQTGLSYAQALSRVVDASEKGLLPRRLDEAGITAALLVLSGDPESSASAFSPAALLLGGPYTTPVHAGSALEKGMPHCVLCGRQVPDGGQWWLVADPRRDWANKVGCVCGDHGAQTLPVHGEGALGEEYVAGWLLAPNEVPLPEVRPTDRRPYVGEGADGARRSAEIDRSEIDSLPTGPHQPGWSEQVEDRRAWLLASVEQWEAQAARSQAVLSDADGLHLERSSLALLRQVWQGRVAWQRHGVRNPTFRFTIDDQPASDVKDIELRWLRDHGYVETAPLVGEDEWAVARTADFGDEVLAHHGADRDRFFDGLPSA